MNLHLLLFLACASGNDNAGDTNSDDTGTDVSVDADGDGHDASVDCDDGAMLVYPGAPELCNGIDDDCDLATDEDFDVDEDGAYSLLTCATGTDCDDADATVLPGAVEEPYDTIDQDCDGADLTDVDADGYDGGPGGLDCDDALVSAYPGALEIPKDGIDQDCDGADSLDADGDGYDDADFGGDDCDDAAGDVNPGAAEVPYDAIDQDCDGADLTDVDRDGFDGGGDGVDCDDTLSSAYPGAAEVPYDSIDQDCDGADVTDVDGDGYDGGASGLDCDDALSSVYPGATEVLKDGIDQDCDGEDNIDGDGDAYGDVDFGGDDCDDADSAINPGATDYWLDDVDSDCGGAGPAPLALADASVSISGDVGPVAEYAGRSVAVCDLDGDSLPDLIVTAPFGSSYLGQIGIFYGDGVSSWAPGMRIDGADTLIQGTEMFLGFGVGCADLDGDGLDDLVSGRGEINYSPYVTTFELLIWYGTGEKLPDMADLDAEASLELVLGVPLGASVVTSANFTVADLDNDGASEIIVANTANSLLTYADDQYYVLGGGQYEGALQLADEARYTIQGEGISFAAALPDLSGDGAAEILFGEFGRTGAGGTIPGRVSVVELDALASDDLERLSYGYFDGVSSEQLGFAAAVGDFDGDGDTDLAIGASANGTGGATAGAVYLFTESAGAVPVAGSSADAEGALYGATAGGLFGHQVVNAGDYDGDGADDLLVTELYADATFGRVWLVSGAQASAGRSLDESALLAWTGEAANAYTGGALAVGDFDGDGLPDFVMGAFRYIESGTVSNGRVYVVLSGS